MEICHRKQNKPQRSDTGWGLSLRAPFEIAPVCRPVWNNQPKIVDRFDTKTDGEPQTELTNCVKVEVAVLGSPFLIVLMVSVEVKWSLFG